MPKRLAPEEERLLEAEAVVEISRSLDRFTEGTGITRERLARAMGCNNAYFSPSHLPKRACLVHWALRRGAPLRRVAAALQADAQQYAALKRLSTEINEAINPRDLGRRGEVVDGGELGIELFAAGAWPAALTHLLPAWEFFKAHPPAPGETDFCTALRVGVRVADWLNYEGHAKQALAEARALLAAARRYSGGASEILAAVADAYRAATVAGQKADVQPERLIKWGEQARRILTARNLDLPQQAVVLRDEAKPYVSWALFGWNRAFRSPEKRYAALHVLDEAEEIAGGEVPREGFEDNWLHTRLTRIQCFGALGKGDEARRCWDETFAAAGLAEVLRRPEHAPLASKVSFAQLAVVAASNDSDGIGALAAALQKDPLLSSFSDRLRRIRLIQAAAERGDLAAIRWHLLH